MNDIIKVSYDFVDSFEKDLDSIFPPAFINAL